MAHMAIEIVSNDGSTLTMVCVGWARGPTHHVPIPICTLACQMAAYAKNAMTHAAAST